MSWHCKTFRDHLHAEPYVSTVIEAGAGMTHDPGFSVFALEDMRRGSYTVFFSPEADFLAMLSAAVSCDKPTWRQGMRLILGSHMAYQIHFPVMVAVPMGERADDD